ncbi:MAG: transposase [Gaiellales bacterium]
MARPLRDQSTDCFHHVMGRGCRGTPIFNDPADREHFAYLLHDVAVRFEWTIIDWVLMPNHHHLLVGLNEPNLGKGMHRLHFMFGQRWNERTPSKGHVYFRRYKNVALRRQGAAGRVMRYIDLNPVRAGLCARPEDWEWSGYNANTGHRNALPFHDTDTAVRAMVTDVRDPEEARLLYARSVHDRLAVVRRKGRPTDIRPTLAEILIPGDVDSIREARETWWYSLHEIARHIGCSPTTVLTWLHAPPTIRTPRALRRWSDASATAS